MGEGVPRIVYLVAVIALVGIIYYRRDMLFTRPFSGGNQQRAEYLIGKVGGHPSVSMSFEGYRKLIPDIDAVEYRALKAAARDGVISTSNIANMI